MALNVMSGYELLRQKLGEMKAQDLQFDWSRYLGDLWQVSFP